jgi:hypothetical protein
MTPKRPVLFLSFQRMLINLVWEWIDQDDLDHGLFYLNCVSEYVMIRNDQVIKKIACYKCIDPTIDPEQVFQRVQRALCLAHAQDRAIWRETYTFEKPIKHEAIIPDFSGKKKRPKVLTETVVGVTSGCNHQLDAFLQKHGAFSQLARLEERFARTKQRGSLYKRPLQTFEWYWMLERELNLFRVIW